MALIWNWLAALVYQYGVYGAGQPSYPSSYEADVPEVLRNSVK